MELISLVELGVNLTRDSLLGLSSLVVITTLVSGASVFTAATSNITGLLDVSSRDNLIRNTEPVSEVDKTLISESVVVVLP